MRAAEATDRVAELILERMTRQGYQDDVTLLAVRLTGGPVPDLFADVPAEPGQLVPLRARLEDWLVALGADEPDIASIEIGVLEAVSNAVEHAYDIPGGRSRVEGTLDTRAGPGQARTTRRDEVRRGSSVNAGQVLGPGQGKVVALPGVTAVFKAVADRATS